MDNCLHVQQRKQVQHERPGSGGNVLAALCSFVIPGLGQLLQGRLLAAVIHLTLDIILWIFLLGWLMHIFSAYSAAVYRAY